MAEPGSVRIAPSARDAVILALKFALRERRKSYTRGAVAHRGKVNAVLRLSARLDGRRQAVPPVHADVGKQKEIKRSTTPDFIPAVE